MSRTLVNILDAHDANVPNPAATARVDHSIPGFEPRQTAVDDIIFDLNNADGLGHKWIATVTAPFAAKMLKALADERANLRNEFDLYISGEWDPLAGERKSAELGAEVQRLKQLHHDIYEVYAGSEGLPCETVSEGYLCGLISKMVTLASEGKS